MPEGAGRGPADRTPRRQAPPGSDDAVVFKMLARWVDAVTRSALPVVLAFLAASVVVFRLTIGHLGISTDTSDMLSRELSFRENYSEYKRAFPQYTDIMVVVVTGDTPDLARQATTVLAAKLRTLPELFKSVYMPAGGEFFDRHMLLYLSIGELRDLAERLIESQAIIGRLASSPSLTGLLELLEAALDRAQTDPSPELIAFLRETDDAIAAANSGRFYQLSWQNLFLGSQANGETHRQLILLQPRLDYRQLQPASDAMQAVRNAAAGLDLDAAHGVRVQITGEVALAHEELQSASRGATTAGIMSLVLVAIVLGAGLGRWQLVVATVVTLLCGLIMTAGFAALAIGHLNLISIAFAVLYIGLGVDYGIHLCLRYRELVAQAVSRADALRRAVAHVGGSLLICTATTAIGFYAFVPTSFTGVSELGLIAGTGMVISLVLSLTLLPALLTLLPAIRADETPVQAGKTPRSLLRVPAARPRLVLGFAAGLAVAAAALLPAAHFDANPISLRNPESESVRAFNELLKTSATSPWSLHVLAENRNRAQRLVSEIRELPVVEDAVSIDRFVPSGQQHKLALIDDLALLLGPQLQADRSQSDSGSPDRVAALRRFAAAVERNSSRARIPADLSLSLQRNLQRFETELVSKPPDAQKQPLDELERSLLGAWPPLLDRLAASLTATEIRLDSLPQELAARWVTGDGRYRIDVLPAAGLRDQESLEGFVEAVRSVATDATGPAVFNIESGRVVVRAFAQALLSSLLAIAMLLLVLLPRKLDVVLVLTPLLLAAALTAAASVAFGIAFNFANVIALPLLLGIGVDSGVHIVHRYRTAPPASGNLLGSSTTRAVLVSALTTICSFGNLAFSPHPGAASMGKLLAIGTGTMLLCMLTVLPALLYWRTPLPGTVPRHDGR